MEESGSISLYMPDTRLDADVSRGILVSAFNCLPLMELGRCDSTLIEITSAIEKQFSQRLCLPTPRPPPPTLFNSRVRSGRARVGRWELSGWERSFQPKALISLHAKPAGWLSRLAMSTTVADSPLHFNHTQEGGINRSPPPPCVFLTHVSVISSTLCISNSTYICIFFTYVYLFDFAQNKHILSVLYCVCHY